MIIHILSCTNTNNSKKLFLKICSCTLHQKIVELGKPFLLPCKNLKSSYKTYSIINCFFVLIIQFEVRIFDWMILKSTKYFHPKYRSRISHIFALKSGLFKSFSGKRSFGFFIFFYFEREQSIEPTVFHTQLHNKLSRWLIKLVTFLLLVFRGLT